MQIINHNGKEFCVAHFQALSRHQFPQVIDAINEQEIVMPEDVDIVTVTNRPEISILMEQLSKHNIHFINKAPKGCYWTNLKKIGFIIEGLQEVNSKYALILDADDVLLTKDVINIERKFRLFQKELIFGATKNNFPDVLIDKVRDRDFRGDFRYLNAGTCFGTVDACLRFYLKASEILHQILVYNPFNSEQLIIRHAFKESTGYVDFDYQCLLFQTFDGTHAWKINDNTSKII